MKHQRLSSIFLVPTKVHLIEPALSHDKQKWRVAFVPWSFGRYFWCSNLSLFLLYNKCSLMKWLWNKASLTNADVSSKAVFASFRACHRHRREFILVPFGRVGNILFGEFLCMTQSHMTVFYHCKSIIDALWIIFLLGFRYSLKSSCSGILSIVFTIIYWQWKHVTKGKLQLFTNHAYISSNPKGTCSVYVWRFCRS